VRSVLAVNGSDSISICETSESSISSRSSCFNLPCTALSASSSEIRIYKFEIFRIHKRMNFLGKDRKLAKMAMF
jgi:hypothetical protein